MSIAKANRSRFKRMAYEDVNEEAVPVHLGLVKIAENLGNGETVIYKRGCAIVRGLPICRVNVTHRKASTYPRGFLEHFKVIGHHFLQVHHDR